MARRKRKTRTHLKGPNNSAETSTVGPKSFVIKSGKVGRSVAGLVQDVRKVMEPNTATRLKERKSNRLRDFLTMAGPLGVSHMIIFGQTDAGTNMRIARCPRGPTVTFRVNKYALTRDVLGAARRPRAPGKEFGTPPLLVLNNFGSEEKHVKLLVTVFQNLFPPIQVHTMRLTQARRIVLLNYNAATNSIDWRHYLISVRPVGVSRNVRRVIEGTTRSAGASSGGVTGKATSQGSLATKRKSRSLVNLADAGDIAEYVLGRQAAEGAETDASEAESEAEDMADPRMAVELSQNYVGRGNAADQARAVRLREIGPRMELKLMKIEEGMSGGEVLYHDHIHKTAAEVAALSRTVAGKRKLAAERREEQERNVARKEAEVKARKTGSRRGKAAAGDEEEGGADGDEEEAEDEGEDEDEFEYEDRFGASGAAGEEAEALDEQLFSDGENESDDGGYDSAGSYDDEDGDDGQGGAGFEDEDDSDLSPIEVGKAGLDDSDDDDESDQEERGTRTFKKARGGAANVRPARSAPRGAHGAGSRGRGAGRGAGAGRGRGGGRGRR